MAATQPSLSEIPHDAQYNLGDILRCRTKAGFPVKTVGLTKQWTTEIGDDVVGFADIDVLPDIVTEGNREASDVAGSDESSRDDDWSDLSGGENSWD